MIGLVRAVTLCATLAFGLVAAQAADKAFKRDELADSAIKLEAQIKGEAGPVPNPQAPCGPTPIPPSNATISAPGCRSSARSRPPRPRIAATGCGSPAPFSRSRPPIRANRPSFWSVPRPRPTSPISAPAIPGESRCAGGTRPVAVGAQAVAAGAGCAAAVARPARGRRRARPVREDARRAWLPAARLHRRFRFRLARAPASSSPRIWPNAPTSRRSWRWPATTSRRCRRKAISSASTA